MARKYGRKNVIKVDPLAYNTVLIGESGVGKTTLIRDFCEKLAGPDSYMFLEFGKEDGADAINGIDFEPIEDWEKFIDVTDDIIENRHTEYSDLRCVIIDTYDELTSIAEQEVIRLHNKENPDKRTKSFKACYGGFNGPTDKVNEIVLDRLWQLKRVGVSFIVIGHTKKNDIIDPVSGESYSMLSTNVDKRYFNALKTKAHFVGVAYVDREIIKVKTGRKNIVTGKEEEKGKVTGEARVICFRDDNFSIDSKSRFADIVEKIPLDADALIKAMMDAIKAEQAKSGVPYAEAAKKQAAEAEAARVKQAEEIERFVQERNADNDESHRKEWSAIVIQKFTGGTDDEKANIRKAIKSTGMKLSDADFPISVLKELALAQ